ncbi:MAG: hypothetical protein J6S85_23450 [Methanobrevibacter sp.]|nr:hypothetical protein [Methanobrevibacter sp.]
MNLTEVALAYIQPTLYDKLQFLEAQTLHLTFGSAQEAFLQVIPIKQLQKFEHSETFLMLVYSTILELCGLDDGIMIATQEYHCHYMNGQW